MCRPEWSARRGGLARCGPCAPADPDFPKLGAAGLPGVWVAGSSSDPSPAEFWALRWRLPPFCCCTARPPGESGIEKRQTREISEECCPFNSLEFVQFTREPAFLLR